tara:strand:+ start:337 stop:2088 length:1752 start_codon:yes stop_codon:yes gene_type:complete
MIKFLTRNPLIDWSRNGIALLVSWGKKFGTRGDRRGLALKALMFILVIGLGLVFNQTLVDYNDANRGVSELGSATDETNLGQLPSVIPMVWQGLGVFLSLVAFLTSLWISDKQEEHRRGTIVVMSLWIAAAASLLAWLPTDVLATKQAISGMALAGETPSIPAYLGKLLLISLVILSIPIVSMVYFRLSLMDRYVVHSFLSPFSFCLFSFIAIWVIADLANNASAFAGLPISRMMTFYVVQVPFVILFVMPIVTLLSALSSLSKMSKANEFITMVGTGRSVLRILLPIFIIGAYSSFICLAFKYDWAPSSVGYKEAIMDTAYTESIALKQGTQIIKDVWARRGWMHVNEVNRRTWFVGKIPYELSDEMADIVVWQLGENDQPEKIWKARRAKWVWDAQPPKWVLTDAQIYVYDEEQIPRLSSSRVLEIEDWSETPWKVLSSSQNPDFLGIPGLSMYLNAHAEAGPRSLAAFRTNWWYVFAEPASCFALVLVAAPLGVVYSRKGVMGGVTGAIGVFALMYVSRGSLVALGHRGTLSPFVAAWTTNLIVGGIGVALLWFRARNRDVPKISELAKNLLSRIRKSST